jgi:hypothetical protein
LQQVHLSWHHSNQASGRIRDDFLELILFTATAIADPVTEPSQFASGLRYLVVIGATALVRFARNWMTPLGAWADELLTRRPAPLVPVALANNRPSGLGRAVTRRKLRVNLPDWSATAVVRTNQQRIEMLGNNELRLPMTPFLGEIAGLSSFTQEPLR